MQLPVAFFDGPVPHRITCMVHTSGGVVTGSDTGELVAWVRQDSPSPLPLTNGSIGTTVASSEDSSSDVGPVAQVDQVPMKKCFSPISMMIQDGSTEITAVTRCFEGNQELVIAGSSEGYISKWSARGGRCFASVAAVPFAPRKLTPYYSSKGQTYIVCSGRSPDIYVLSATTLQAVFMLNHLSSIVDHVMSKYAHNEEAGKAGGGSTAPLAQPDPMSTSGLDIPAAAPVSMSELIDSMSFSMPGLVTPSFSAPSSAVNRHRFTLALTVEGVIRLWDLDSVLGSQTDLSQHTFHCNQPYTSLRIPRLPSMPVALALSPDNLRLCIFMGT